MTYWYATKTVRKRDASHHLVPPHHLRVALVPSFFCRRLLLRSVLACSEEGCQNQCGLCLPSATWKVLRESFSSYSTPVSLLTASGSCCCLSNALPSRPSGSAHDSVAKTQTRFTLSASPCHLTQAYHVGPSSDGIYSVFDVGWCILFLLVRHRRNGASSVLAACFLLMVFFADMVEV